ncbi:MAG: type I restriction-modification system subunit M N-terminal domain-containing protein [Acidimicrobiales bacterium]
MAGQVRKTATKPAKTLEQGLWDTADALRGNQEPSEYKHIVLGLVFLKYIFDWFEVRHQPKEAMADSEEQFRKSSRYQLMTNSLTNSSIGFLILQLINGFSQHAKATLTTIQGCTRRGSATT